MREIIVSTHKLLEGDHVKWDLLRVKPRDSEFQVGGGWHGPPGSDGEEEEEKEGVEPEVGPTV